MGRLEEYFNLFDAKRRDWDPDEPTASFTRSVSDITEFELHHTGASGPSSLTFAAKKSWLLGIERYHEVTKSWSDIFYQVFVFADGEIWEGRDLRRASTSKAANAITVHLPGNNPQVTPAQHEAFVKVARWATFGDPAKVRGHSDRSATACPGDNGRLELDAIRAALAHQPAPVPVPEPDTTDIDALRDTVAGLELSVGVLRTRLGLLENLARTPVQDTDSIIEEIRRRLVD